MYFIMWSSGFPDWAKICASMILPNVGGFINGYFTRNQVNGWYKQIEKPKGTPPDWVFGPVWTSLYCGMGLASYLVWRDGGGFNGDAKLALTLYATQFVLNQIWTPIFFLKHDFSLALVDIILLVTTAAATTASYYPINKTAFYLMIPYLGWISYAIYLTAGFWKLNSKKKQIKED